MKETLLLFLICGFAHGQSKSAPEQLRAELSAPTSGWLGFSAPSARGDWDLFVMRPDGSRRVPLTNTPRWHEMGLRFSPDGQRILYYRAPVGTVVENNNYGTFELIVAEPSGSNPRSLGEGHAWAAWSPDGRRLASLAPDGIHFIDVATGRALAGTVRRQGLFQQLVWSPDGRCFAGTGNGLGPFWNIGALPVNGGKIIAVSDTTRFNCTPDWTPDSRSILYAHGIVGGQSGYAQLWKGTRDGTERRLLYAEENTHIYGGCASPEGKFLLFTRSREDLGGQENKRITLSIISAQDVPLEVRADSTEAPRLDLGPGWEPHWTANPLPPP